MPLGMEVGLGPGDIVLDGDPARPPPKGEGRTPHFSAHIMSVVAKRVDGSRRHLVQRYVGLGSGHIELDGDPGPSKRGAQQPPPIFDMCCQTAGW